MAAQRHNFALTSSFNQRLSLLVIVAVVLTSFLAWPSHAPTWLHLIKWIGIAGVLFFFGEQLYRLSDWSLNFWIDESGKAGLSSNGESCQFKRFFVSPFVLVLQLQSQHPHLIIVWRDMLDAPGYRHLCRLVLRHG